MTHQDSLLIVSLTTECNLACPTCPMKEFRGHKNKYPLDNFILMLWIEQFFNPQKWVVELTGGEPALYEGIEELCQWLSEHNYTTVIKTNGLIPINKYKGIKRIAAWHNYDKFPVSYDEILIIDKLDRERKEAYCKENNIPYKVIGFNDDHSFDIPHGFRYTTSVNPAGHCIPCFAKKPVEKDTGTDDLNRINHRAPDIREACKDCKYCIDTWRFLDR